MRRMLWGAAVLGSVLVFAGCQSAPKVESETDPTANLAAYKTFALMPLPNRFSGSDPGAVLRLGGTITETVSAELKAKGYQEADVKTADFAVKVAGKVVPRIDVTDWGYSHSPGPWVQRYPYSYVRRDVTVDSYEEGTLIVEVYDGKSKKMVWTGWATGRTGSKPASPEAIRETVQRILAKYPGAK